MASSAVADVLRTFTSHTHPLQRTASLSIRWTKMRSAGFTLPRLLTKEAIFGNRGPRKISRNSLFCKSHLEKRVRQKLLTRLTAKGQRLRLPMSQAAIEDSPPRRR
jgi:hypothetical protein